MPLQTAHTIIMADEAQSLTLFRDSSTTQIQALAEQIAQRYQGVILHLGHKDMFKRGGFFFYTTSQQNLKIFCDILKTHHVKVYLWILDSFGAEAFLRLYGDYQKNLQESLAGIQKLKLSYDGLVVDIEWINHPQGNHNQQYLEILRTIKGLIGSQALYAFAPVIDDPIENQRRGYNESEMRTYLTNIIAPIYVKDGGFYIEEEVFKAHLTDKRISILKHHYKAQNYLIAVSLESGLIITRNQGHHYFVRSLNSAQDPVFKHFELVKHQPYHYYDISVYRAIEPFDLVKNDTEIETIQPNEVVYYIQVKENILESGDFIWEYFLVDHPVP